MQPLLLLTPEDVERIARKVALEVVAQARPVAVVYSQASLPPATSKLKFQRAWRAAHAAGDPGATKRGRLQLLAHETWEKHEPLVRKQATERLGAMAKVHGMGAHTGAHTVQETREAERPRLDGHLADSASSPADARARMLAKLGG
jgi:hypothetical protein